MGNTKEAAVPHGGRAWTALAGFLGSDPEKHDNMRSLSVVHVNIVLYALCFWLCQPVLPFLSKKLGADPVTMGFLDTTFSFVQLLGGPVMGRMCDIKGPRFTIMVAQAAGAMVYLLQSIAWSLPILFISKFPGLLLHCMIGAQASVTDLAEPGERAKAMGRLSLSYGIGMVVGSSLGGLIADAFGHYFVALLAAMLSASTLPLSVVLMSGGSRKAQAAVADPAQDKQPAPSSRSMLHLLAIPSLLSILLLRFLVGLALSVQRSTFQFVGPDVLGMGAGQFGYLISYSAVTSLLTNVFFVGWATHMTGSDERAMQYSIAVLIPTFLVYGNVQSVSGMLAVCVPMIMSSTLLYTVAASVITKAVDPGDTGASIGLSHGIQTLTGVLSPTLGGYLYSEHGLPWLGVFCAACCVVALLFAFFSMTVHPHDQAAGKSIAAAEKKNKKAD